MFALKGIAMPMNIEKYRKHLASFNLSKDREDEIIRYIYNIMDEFVSIAFSKHPVQQAIQEKEQKSLQRNNSVIDSKDQNTTQQTD